MDINPYLNFNGNCAEAFRFYAEVLGGTIVMSQTHGESAVRDHVPAAWHDKILHIQLQAGRATLMGSDAPPDHYAKPQGLSVSIQVTASDEGARIFKALSQNGSVTMPYQATFWSPGFGMAIDRFGTPWMVNCVPAEAVAPAI